MATLDYHSSPPVPPELPQGRSDPLVRKRQLAWILNDWAGSGFGMIGIGVVFSSYFTSSLAPEHLIDGAVRRGLMVAGKLIPADGVFALLTAASAFLVVLTAPVMGAIADIKGWGKPLYIGTSVAGALVAMTMCVLDPGEWKIAAVLYVLASFCFISSLTFYNAFLPLLAPNSRQGRLSGFGFAAGYIGGALAVIAGVFLLKPFLGVKGVLFFGGLWWLVFAIPSFLLMPVSPPQNRPRLRKWLVAEGFVRVGHTFANIKTYRMLFLFLVAFLIYSNGIDTVINVSPAWTTEVLKVTGEQNTLIFLCVQFVAMPGAILCGFLADKFGNKPVIIVTLMIWCVLVTATPFVPSIAAFVVVACGLGLVLGGVQSSSRAMMARLAPAEIRNEAFGFFSLSGKAVSIVGPVFYSAVSTIMGSKWAVIAVVPFLVVGLLIMLKVKEPKASTTSLASPMES